MKMGQSSCHGLLAVLLNLWVGQALYTQTRFLTGLIYDGNDEPMPFAHVLLLQGQDSVLGKRVTELGIRTYGDNDFSERVFQLTYSFPFWNQKKRKKEIAKQGLKKNGIGCRPCQDPKGFGQKNIVMVKGIRHNRGFPKRNGQNLWGLYLRNRKSIVKRRNWNLIVV